MRLWLKLSILFFLLIGMYSPLKADDIDFTKAEVEVLTKSPLGKVSLEMLEAELKVRTGLTWDKNTSSSSSPLVVLTTVEVIKGERKFKDVFNPPSVLNKDGFKIAVYESGQRNILVIAGHDARGLLFGVGYFLRKSRLAKNSVMVPSSISIDTWPETPLRGHQLGYRPKVNSYDGFTVAMWEQYIRDLIVFGTNAVELMPPNTDDDSHSPMFTLPQKEMLVEMSGLLEKYGLDVWMWYPLMHGDYADPNVVEKSLVENEEIFKSIPKLDAVFVPGGDPGKQTPKVLFEHLARKIKVLHKYHPNAEIWISPQGYSAEWMEEFIALLKDYPSWISGVVHGPWVRMDVNDLRKVVPQKYPIRRYPDITHSIDGQYFVPSWDYAYTVTQNRETINPRPLDHGKIYRSVAPENAIGFISYSEGVNDDVNKMIWSGLGWDRSSRVIDILRDYSRYFIGVDYEDDFAQGLLNLEKNWQGSLIDNKMVVTHHQMFREMEKKAAPNVQLNWRFQSALYRSYYDVYNYHRLIYETSLEQQAMSILRKAQYFGSKKAMDLAMEVVDKSVEQGTSSDERQRVFELAEALFQSIRMQLSTDKYYAKATIRGGNLDLIDTPLNNRLWLESEFVRIRNLDEEEDRINELDKIVNWQNPGPGGYYDDLGDLTNQPHMVYDLDYEKDPNSFRSSFVGLPGGYSLEMDRIRRWRVSWKTYMQTIYGLPLQMHYEDLDPRAQYRVKVTYVEEEPIRLRTDDGTVIHDYLEPEESPRPVEFDIPMSETSDGVLDLFWEIDPSGKGPGRGCSVAEVWLIKN
ncbi:hypothetical protein [Membranihabitans marinus]|uniref:hypothetical protein n=1 Tax=Membranihabitans marinus TaxID=1227546 RepID=UPI001F3BEA9F|nr:hypothetical protein [Membranihabitans marinus]